MRSAARRIGVLAGVLGFFWLGFLMGTTWMAQAFMGSSSRQWMDDLWLPAWLALGAIGIGTLVGARSGSFWGPGVAAVGSVFFGTWGVVYFTTPNDRAMFWPFFVIGIIQAAAAVVLVLTRPSGARSEPEAQSPSDGTGSAASSAE